MKFNSRLLKHNRTLSWVLVLFSIIMVFSGYGRTRSFLGPLSPLWFFTRDVHVWLCFFFTLQLFIHISIAELLSTRKWFTVLRKSWRKRPSSYLLLKTLQKITGYIFMITSPLLILTGLEFHLPGIGPFFPLFQHVRLDLYVILPLITHIGLGAKMMFHRKKTSNILSNALILITAVTTITLLLYVDSVIL